jgi:hypothetical protein
MPPTAAINGVGVPFTLSHRIDHSRPLSKLPLVQRMASNDNDKRKMEEEAEFSMTRKRLRYINDDGGNDDSSDSSDSPKEESLKEGGGGDGEGGLLRGNINEATRHLHGKAICQARPRLPLWRRWRHPLDVAGHTTHTKKLLALR